MNPRTAALLLSVMLAGGQALQAEEPLSDWTFSLGAFGGSGPKYAGSDESQMEFMPYVELDYKGVVGIAESDTVDGFGIYVRPFRRGPWSLGFLGLMEMEGRNQDDAKALKGMGDRRANQYYGIETAYRTEAFFSALEVLKGSRKNSGTVASLTFGRDVRLSDRVGLEFGITGLWGDKDYQMWECGITPAQATRRQALIAAGNHDLDAEDGRPFTPKAGLRQVSASMSMQWSLTERWTTFASVEQGRLLGDAAKSPLTRRKNQSSFGFGFAYRFVGGSDGD